ncbi:MAG: hypothetical protein ACLT98_10075 [Eggerthellaceae bacterium]
MQGKLPTSATAARWGRLFFEEGEDAERQRRLIRMLMRADAIPAMAKAATFERRALSRGEDGEYDGHLDESIDSA